MLEVSSFSAFWSPGDAPCSGQKPRFLQCPYCGRSLPPHPFPLHNFPKLEHPQLSKVLQMGTLVCFPLQQLPALLPSESGQPGAGVRCPQSGPRVLPEGSLLVLTLLPTAPLLLLMRLWLE